MIDIIGTIVFGWIWDHTGGRWLLRRKWRTFAEGAPVVLPAYILKNGALLREASSFIVVDRFGGLIASGSRDGAFRAMPLFNTRAVEWHKRRFAIKRGGSGRGVILNVR